jgi:hypothetical protein
MIMCFHPHIDLVMRRFKVVKEDFKPGIVEITKTINATVEGAPVLNKQINPSGMKP